MEYSQYYPTLFICRGLPGSGKSSLAQHLAPSANVAADDFFMNEGKYEFDATKLPAAHLWCKGAVRLRMQEGQAPIAVHNTFSQAWEVEAYLKLAHTYGYSVFIVEAQNDFGNIHGVSQAAVERMRDRWEPLIGEKIGIRRQLRYRFNRARAQLLRKLPWRH